MYTVGLLFAGENVETWTDANGPVKCASSGEIMGAIAAEMVKPDLDWNELPIGIYVFNSYNRSDTAYYGVEIIPAKVNLLEY